MLRFLFNLASATSLLLAVVVCTLWFRSYRLTDQVEWRNAGGSRAAHTAYGHAIVHVLLADWSNHPAEFRAFRYERREPMPPFNWFLLLCSNRNEKRVTWEWRGFAWYERSYPGVTNAQAVAPFWSLQTVTAILPFAWTTARLRSILRRRHLLKNLHLCSTCGYDLRATPHRCPECGTPAPAN
jgi:hypothetical protein